jgi:hypothetical protein
MILRTCMRRVDEWDVESVQEHARSATRAVEEALPDRCRQRRVDVVGLAHDLEIVVRSREVLSARAQWYRLRTAEPEVPTLWDEPPREIDVIEVRCDLRDSTRRFAIAHEIAHVILHRRAGKQAHRVSLAWEERFANAFAAELLIPRSHRAEIVAEFRSAEEPLALLRLADSLGVSPRTLLRFAATDGWLVGIDRVWLDVRSLLNRHTKRDKRLRVFDAVLDRQKWFIPRNRSVAGVLGSDDWLVSAGRRTRRTEARVDISRRAQNPPHRFVHCSVPARLVGLRLGRPSIANGMEFLACAELLTSAT